MKRRNKKLKAIEKNPKGTKGEADQIKALNKVIEGLESLQSALDEHANSISGDTKDYIKELADTQGGIKDTSKEKVRSTAESGRGPVTEAAIEDGTSKKSRDAAADAARASLSRDEADWRKSLKDPSLSSSES